MRKKEKPLRVSSFFIYLCPVKASIDPDTSVDTTVYIFDIELFLFLIQSPRYSISKFSTIDSISKKGKEKNDYIYIYVTNERLFVINSSEIIPQFHYYYLNQANANARTRYAHKNVVVEFLLFLVKIYDKKKRKKEITDPKSNFE